MDVWMQFIENWYHNLIWNNLLKCFDTKILHIILTYFQENLGSWVGSIIYQIQPKIVSKYQKNSITGKNCTNYWPSTLWTLNCIVRIYHTLITLATTTTVVKLQSFLQFHLTEVNLMQNSYLFSMKIACNKQLEIEIQQSQANILHFYSWYLQNRPD